MKMRIYLNADGHKQVAQGFAPYTWHFTERLSEPDGSFYGEPPTDSTYITEIEFELPKPEAAVHVALKRLHDQETEARMELEEKLSDINIVRSKLLAITCEVA